MKFYYLQSGSSKRTRELKRNFLLLILFLSFFVKPKISFGTHISGGEITYKWISGNTYELTLTLYRDCSGVTAPNNPTINYSSISCSKNLSVTLTKKPGTGQEITHPCSTSVTRCGGGTSVGIEEYQYTAMVTLPANCTDWVFGYSICCRNCAITTLNFNGCANAPATYVEATLNNIAAPTNSSPIFTNIPVTFICIGQQFKYNHGAYDSDGDSIVYSLIPPRSAVNTNVVFQPGLSASNPLNSSPAVSLNSFSGDITINPTAVEVGVMAVLVKEYRNGILIGSVVRDMEIWTQTCSNILPTASGINGTNNFSMVACPGSPIQITFNSADGNPGQIVSMSWNGGIPWATFTTSGSPYPIGQLTWTPLLSDARSQPYTFTITVQDNNCPSNGFQTYSYSIVVPYLSATATSTNSLCASTGTGMATAIPTGDSPFTYLWSPGGNTTSTINGLNQGSYVVTITESNGCTTTASTTITSPPAINSTVLGLTNVSCYGGSNGSATLNTNGGNPPYTFNWTPSGGNSSGAFNLSAGNYTVRITDANLCTLDVPVTISQPPMLSSAVSSQTNNLCNGMNTGTATITANGGTPPYEYTWTPGGNTLASATELSAGLYTVSTTDAQGCTSSIPVNISQPTPIELAVTTSSSTCGAANGMASVFANGGTGTYDYQWTPGGTSSSITGLAAGTYTVLVADANGCTISATAAVSNIGGPTVAITSVSHPDCYGNNNGSATISVNSGTPPYNYLWSPGGGNAATANNLGEGTYTISVVDGNNCISALTVNIESPPPIILTLSPQNPLCLGTNTGAINTDVTGGTGTYSYSWFPGGSPDADLSNVPAGIFQLTVTDNAGCSQTSSVQLDNPIALSGAVTMNTPVSCYGGNNGQAAVQVFGGATPYNFEWSPSGGNQSTATGLSSGNYFVEVTDQHNCALTIPIQIAEPLEINSSISTSPVLCSGEANGAITVVANGGTQPYNYNWSPAISNASSATNLISGNYSVLITDVNGCSITTSAIINEPTSLSVNIIYLNDVSCNGGNNGAASLAASGGTAPYNYSWSPLGISTSTADSLAANVYNVTISDANLCTYSALIVINEPTSLQSSTASVSSVSCYNGSDGSASVNVIGGTSPFSYTWNSTLPNSPNISNLAAGIYSVSITDGNGCIVTHSVTVTQPQELLISSTGIPSSCGISNGTIHTTITGGTAPFIYTWNPGGQGGANLNGLQAGVYSVIATDQNGCTTDISTSVSNIPNMTIAATSTGVSCYGGNNGNASVSVNGGTQPYHYLWAVNNSTNPSLSSLYSGTYIVTVTDGNLCEQIISIDITEPPALSVQASSVTNVSCNGGNDASASVLASGGSAPFTYLWNPGGNNQPIANSLTAGLHSVSVTDALGCTTVIQISINEPPAISYSTIATPSACGASNGSATINVSGGTPPINYSWAPGGMNGSSINNISAGVYSVTVTDAKNCSSTSSIAVSNIDGPTLNISSLNNVSCYNGTNGNASIQTINGTAPYTYQWFPNGGVSPNATNLAAGNYTVEVRDANQCITSLPISISEPAPLVDSIIALPALCAGQASGSALAIVYGGVSPYIYQWSSGNYSSGFVTGLSSGLHSVSITDANGCTHFANVTITEPMSLEIVSATQHVSCYGLNDARITTNVTGGTAPYSYNWLPYGGNSSFAENLSNGTFSVQITDANGCELSASNYVESPSILLAEVTGGDVHCFNGNDGYAQSIVTGGISPYTFQWSHTGNQPSISNLVAGTYFVTVTDSNGCSTSDSIFISQPEQLQITLENPLPICIGQQVDLHPSVSGGIEPYNFNWSNHIYTASQIISPEVTMNLFLFVSDANGCEISSDEITISVREPVLAVLPVSDTICEGSSVVLSMNATGGNGGPYFYSWENGSTENSITVSPTNSTTYLLTVTDNCTLLPAIVEVPVVVIPTPVANFLPNPIVGCAPLDAHFFDLAFACPSCTYSWEFGDGTSSSDKNGSHLFETPGEYSVTHTVTNSFGCYSELQIPAAVKVYPVPESAFSTSSEIVSEENPLISFIDHSVLTSQWSWDFGDNRGNSILQNPVYSYSDTGTFVVRLISMNEYGCIDTSYNKIQVRPEYGIFIPNAFTPNNDGVNDTFMPLMSGVSSFEMLIYDRWGIVIFDTTDLLSPWNGRFQNSENICQNDVYVYKVICKDLSGKKHSVIGHVTLLK